MLQHILMVLLCTLVLSTAVHAATLQLPKTGQTVCYNAAGGVIACAGTGQDGDKLKGAAWPVPRFTDNANGTITDNLTGLIWLKNAGCFGIKTWGNALTSANTLASGSCGLTDGSVAGSWRLPNITELESLVDLSRSSPALPLGHPFSFVNSYLYWSSSTHAGDTASAWAVDMDDNGAVYYGSKDYYFYVWPVRGGQ